MLNFGRSFSIVLFGRAKKNDDDGLDYGFETQNNGEAVNHQWVCLRISSFLSLQYVKCRNMKSN